MATSKKKTQEQSDTTLGPGGEPLPPFEESIERLSAIVDELEKGDLALERSLELFEEGMRLAHASETRLGAAERRVEELLAIDADGRPIVRELESDLDE